MFIDAEDISNINAHSNIHIYPQHTATMSVCMSVQPRGTLVKRPRNKKKNIYICIKNKKLKKKK